MTDVAIRCEGLAKKYRIGEREPYKALRDVIRDAFASPFRRFRSALQHSSNGGKGVEKMSIWALNDVSFEIKRGEVVGIIGRNGAGKSTLLKILSRITEPTEGHADIWGRVGSLLEVGTGFHPELTGRDNIFLNGAILGMRKSEVARKFDEIVAFAEVEKFIDTPVKRYSSGMYVRLAFAVAAHMETEILLVDEVLAVGDVQFQKKCLGRIGEVAKHGRTVLFISHNMAAVKSLTTTGIVLNEGSVRFNGTTEAAVQAYLQTADSAGTGTSRSWGQGTHTAIRTVRLLNSFGESTNQYLPGEPLRVEVEIETDGAPRMSIELFLSDSSESRIGMASIHQFHGQMLPREKGRYLCALNLAPMWLASGRYFFEVRTSVINVDWDHSVERALVFDVPFSNPLGYEFDFKQTMGLGSIVLLPSAPILFNRVRVKESVTDGLPTDESANTASRN
jgi:lipopolysaccharide transport system ATP-binding protein